MCFISSDKRTGRVKTSRDGGLRMSNTFSGLEIGRRALSYFRQGIETAGHNISNADVDGYSRQRVEASATTPYTLPGINSSGEPGQIGTGVGIDAINRVRDAFLDAQYRGESVEGGFWEAASTSMEYIEMFIGEPSETGISTALENLNQSLQELQKRPDSSSTRESFARELDNLCTMITHTYENLSEYRTSLDQDIELQVQNANDLIDRIADLNSQIETVYALGNKPNDLMDKRDILLEDLTRLANVTVSTDSESGAVSVSLAGRLLVQNTETRHLVLVPQNGNQGFYDVQVEENEFLSSSDPDTASIAAERDAVKGVHSMEVQRIATETRWAIGSDFGYPGVSSAEEALGIEGSFSLQVGSDGIKVLCSPASGTVLLKEPLAGEAEHYSFRVAAGNEEKVVDIDWNAAAGVWDITGGSALNSSTDSELTLSDLGQYFNNELSEEPVQAEVVGDRMILSNSEDLLVSLTDLKGNLVTSKLGLEKSSPTIDITVSETDSLQTIANRINGAYGSGSEGPDTPEEWVHATVERSNDGGLYLNVESNSVGEASRINVGTGLGENLETAKLLGLVFEDTDGTTRTKVNQYSQDALIKVDNNQYLSSVNNFSDARLVTSSNSYRADVLQSVINGVTFNIKGEGTTDLIIERHVEGGFIEGLLHSRDDLVTGAVEFLNNFAKTLSDQMNAIHYSGHGTGTESNMTGTALLEPVTSLSEAAANIGVNSSILSNTSLIAASGDNGSGISLGSGDGSVALEMLDLYYKPVFDNDSSSINEYYSSFVASMGSQSRQAQVMFDNQETLLTQISNQRKSISGVNIDEEMTDIIQFQQSYQAVSRYITVLDEMMETVINGMGIVGR